MTALSGVETLFLTGGTGFLGGHLRERLADRDVAVTLLARDPADVDVRDEERLVEGDVTDPDGVAVEGDDAVVHLAA